MKDVIENISQHQNKIQELQGKKTALERKHASFDRDAVTKIEACEKRQKQLKDQLNNEYSRKIDALKEKFAEDLGYMNNRHELELQALRDQLTNQSSDYKQEISELTEQISYHNSASMHALNYRFGLNIDQREILFEPDPGVVKDMTEKS